MRLVWLGRCETLTLLFKYYLKGNSKRTLKKMQGKDCVIDGRNCHLFSSEHPQVLLIQPTSAHEAEWANREVELIKEKTDIPFALITFDVADWERELAPWSDSLLSKREDVGGHAQETLGFIESSLLPRMREVYGELPCILGGYSLAALFALWAAYLSSSFLAIAASSPSVWLKGWPEFTQTHTPQTESIFLGLGEQEEKTKKQAFARVGDNIRRYHQLLSGQLGENSTVLRWNPGGHFKDGDRRTAEGFAWAIDKLAASSRPSPVGKGKSNS